jgi:hypothetical protein
LISLQQCEKGFRIASQRVSSIITKPCQELDCCDLHLADEIGTMALVTIMVLVTTSTRSGRVSSLLMVRRIGRAVCRQPQPVGLGAPRRMPNKLREILIRHTL